MMMRFPFAVVAALALLLGVVAESKADFITNHAETNVTGQVGGVPNFNITGSGGPLVSIAQGAASSSFEGASQSISCLAQALGVSGGQFILDSAVNASAFLSPQGNGASQASGNATAVWQDVLFLGSTDPNVVGSTLRLTFFSQGGGSIVDLGLGAGGGGFGAEKILTVEDAVHSSLVNPLVHSDGSFSGWDSLSEAGNATSYQGTYHVDISIDPNTGAFNIPGAFYFEIESIDGATAFAGNFGTSESVSSFDPTRFLSVTLPDKGNVTPESLGVSVTFDSGIVSPNLPPSATAVPEPASLTLLGIGVAGLLGYGWRRRKQAVA